MRGYRPWEVSHLVSREISRRMPSELCLETPWARVMTTFIKHVFFAKVAKVGQVSGSDPLSSDPLSSDPLSSDIETILFKAGTKAVQTR